MPYQIFIDSSSGMSKELREKYHIDYFRMGLNINGEDKLADLDFVEFSREQMFDWVRDPKVVIKTSLVTPVEFESKMEKYLKKGIDILYIACADALSGTRQAFELFKEELLEKYPERKIISVNSARAEAALSLMAMEASRLQDQGKSLEEVAQYVEDNKQYYHETGSVDTLKYLRMYGRVSGAAAFFADTLNIKPVIIFDIHGHNYTMKKVRGEKKAMEECFNYIKAHVVEGVTDVIYLGETVPVPALDYLYKRITEELHIPVEKYYIGPIVSVCCGPGMYGCWFKGDLVTVEAK